MLKGHVASMLNVLLKVTRKNVSANKVILVTRMKDAESMNAWKTQNVHEIPPVTTKNVLILAIQLTYVVLRIGVMFKSIFLSVNVQDI